MQSEHRPHFTFNDPGFFYTRGGEDRQTDREREEGFSIGGYFFITSVFRLNIDILTSRQHVRRYKSIFIRWCTVHQSYVLRNYFAISLIFCLFIEAFGATSTTAAVAPTNTGFMFGSQAAPAAGTTASAPLNSTFTFGTAPVNNPIAAQTSAQPLNFGTGLQAGSTIRPFGSATAFGTTQAATVPATGTTGKLSGGGSVWVTVWV